MFNSRTTILWTQVLALGLVQGAITLMWLVYNLYLDKLLSQFGFSATLVTSILILENILAMVMEPLMGTYSDRAQRWWGSRFPFITVGVILASGLLMAIATWATFGQPMVGLRWLLPVLLVAWAIAMTLFRSPALSLLGRYAYGRDLPQAASILTLVGALIGALGPTAKTFILGLGAPVTFGIASLILLAAAATLRAVHPPSATAVASAYESRRSTVAPVNLILIFLAGWGLAMGSRLILKQFPIVLAAIPGINVGWMMGLIFIALAATAVPAGLMAQRLGNQRSMLIGIGGLAALMITMGWIHQVWAAVASAIALGTLLSLLRNGAVPFALAMVPADQAGLGVGMFFSGAALAANLLATFFKQPDAMGPVIVAFVVVGSLLVAGGAIASSRSGSQPSPHP